jgi:hypothetical protein
LREAELEEQRAHHDLAADEDERHRNPTQRHVVQLALPLRPRPPRLRIGLRAHIARIIEIDESLTRDVEDTPGQHGRSPSGSLSSYNTPLSVAHSAHRLQLEARVAAMVKMRKSSQKKLTQQRRLEMRT